MVVFVIELPTALQVDVTISNIMRKMRLSRKTMDTASGCGFGYLTEPSVELRAIQRAAR